MGGIQLLSAARVFSDGCGNINQETIPKLSPSVGPDGAGLVHQRVPFSGSHLPSGELGKAVCSAWPPPCANTCVLVEQEPGEKSCQSQLKVTSAAKPATNSLPCMSRLINLLTTCQCAL